jgi:hypothetical protein
VPHNPTVERTKTAKSAVLAAHLLSVTDDLKATSRESITRN